MNKLIEILIRWSTNRSGFHTDIRKMYNTVKLAEKDCCSGMMHVADDPYVKVIKTLIYGVKSSGNQAESGLRTIARASTLIQKDIYVEDCFSGENSWNMIVQTTDDL